MIGNDIVDFQKASLESNWLRKGYLDKLFCKEEQEIILSSADPNRVVWLLWTMKEAGYKIHFRHRLIRKYQPKDIICSNLIMNPNCASGEIYYDGHIYLTRSILNDDLVHTSAVTHHSDFNILRTFIKSNYNKSGPDELIDNCQDLISKNAPQDYKIVKSRHNLPDLLNLKTGEKRPLSISHHGVFLSLVFLSNK